MSEDAFTPALYRLAGLYNIKLEWLAEGTLTSTERCARVFPSDYSWGPQHDCGVSLKKRYVYGYGAGVEMVLHEMVHCIVGKPSMKLLCEGYLLMPFEWELAKYIAKWMKVDRGYFLDEVRNYQENTDITFEYHRECMRATYDCLEETDRRTAWWKKGVERAQIVGLLDSNKKPTFKSPNWEGNDVLRVGRTWSVNKELRALKARSA